MTIRGFRLPWQMLLALLGCLLLSACVGRARPNTVAAPDVPASFDLTVRADKDGQFDLDGATLAPEDLRDHLKYRNEEGKPVTTMLLKPGEKQKVTDRHIGQLFRFHAELKVRTFVQEKEGGEIAEVQAGSETH